MSACLITKDAHYPREILDHLQQFSFGEILIRTHCDGVYCRAELIAKAYHDYVYCQDDDCIAPVAELFELARPNVINCAMKPVSLAAYRNRRIALIGWGSIFPKSMLRAMAPYRAQYGDDFFYRSEFDRILTWFNFPQNRMDLPIQDLASAYAADRMSNQPSHYDYIPLIDDRCAALAESLQA